MVVCVETDEELLALHRHLCNLGATITAARSPLTHNTHSHFTHSFFLFTCTLTIYLVVCNNTHTGTEHFYAGLPGESLNPLSPLSRSTATTTTEICSSRDREKHRKEKRKEKRDGKVGGAGGGGPVGQGNDLSTIEGLTGLGSGSGAGLGLGWLRGQTIVHAFNCCPDVASSVLVCTSEVFRAPGEKIATMIVIVVVVVVVCSLLSSLSGGGGDGDCRVVVVMLLWLLLLSSYSYPFPSVHPLCNPFIPPILITP